MRGVVSGPARRFRIELSTMRSRALFFHHVVQNHLEVRGILTDLWLILEWIVCRILMSFASTKGLIKMIVIRKSRWGVTMMIKHFCKWAHSVKRFLSLNFLYTSDWVCVKIVITKYLTLLLRIWVWRSNWKLNNLTRVLTWHRLRESLILLTMVIQHFGVHPLILVLIVAWSSFHDSFSQHLHAGTLKMRHLFTLLLIEGAGINVRESLEVWILLPHAFKATIFAFWVLSYCN